MTRKLSVPNRVSTLALAIALIAGPSPAAAESLKGTPTVSFGSATVNETATTTDVTISSGQVVIDWTPDDNAVGNFGLIAFQDSGTTANFSSASDFAVLNRINVADSSRGIFLNGNINSLVNSVTGGSVFFYSPSGFVIGSSAIINVGSLVLSASPIAVDGSGNFLQGTTVTFNQAPNSSALINTVSGSQINANGSGSYVALVAPIITHHGTIRTDSAAALVAAEAATINFSPDGLFDIQVTVGTDDPTGVHVDGGTIARNSATEGADHSAYLVAVAKNDAVTMLIDNGGSLGFDTATSAANGENNSVILSGGKNVAGGQISFPSGTSTVNLSVEHADFHSNVTAAFSGGADISTNNGDTNFSGDLTLTAGANSFIDAINGNTLTIAGNLSANVDKFGVTNVTGNFLRLAAFGGSSLTVGGNVTLNANAYGAFSTGDGLDGGSATGGSVMVQTGTNSSLDIAGSLTIFANGYGGDNFFSNAAGGSGKGGNVQILSETSGASINVGGAVGVSAEGQGGSSGECSACSITGGNGTGGDIFVQADGGGSTLQFDSSVSLSAGGFGGAGDAAAGTGFGGNTTLGASDGSATSVGGDTTIDASGFGGYGFDITNGGLGHGGFAMIGTGGAAGSTVDLTGPVFVTATGQGGDGLNGGTGTGGVATFNAILGTIHAMDDVFVAATSDGGFANSATGTGGSGLADIETIVTPAMTEASLFTKGGTIIVDGLTIISTDATGGDGGFGGGDGGNAVAGGQAGAIGGGPVIHAANSDDGPSVIQLGDVIITSDAFGGQGGTGLGGTNGGDGGNGGTATAGRVVVTAAAGSGDVTAGAVIASATAEGGAGGDGGNSDGGNGGNGGDGGQATGGFINVGSESGNVNFAQGANNGTATYASIVAFASATGGTGGDGTLGTISGVGGNGGDAFGGASVLLVRGSDVTVGNVLLDGSATGGDGGLSPDTANGDGGDATAGAVGVLVTNRFNLPLQRATLTAGDISGTAIAVGGTGGNGNGLSLSVGGNQFVVLNSDATINSVSLVNQADAFDSGSINASPSYFEVRNGGVDIAGSFVFQTPGSVAMWADSATLDAAQIIVDADNFIHDDRLPAPASPGTFSANNIFLTTGQDLIVDGHLLSLNGVGFTAPGLIDVDNVTSTNGPLALNAGSTINADNLSGAALVFAQGGGNVTVGSVNSGGNAQVSSTGGSTTTGGILAGGNVFIGALTDISTANVAAAGSVTEQAGGEILTGAINAAGFVQLGADGDINAGSVDANGIVDIFSSNGAIGTGSLSSLLSITLDAPVSISFGNVIADSLDFDSGGAVTGGNIVAGTQATGSAGTTIALGDINVGVQLAGGLSEDGFAVGMSAPGSISVGDVTADEAIGFATLADLNAGNLTAGTDVMTLIGGNTTIASITTPGTGRTYHGDAQMFLDAGGPDNFDASLVFAATPLRSGGSYTVTGAISTGSIKVGAATISTGAITAPIGIYLDSASATTTGALTSNGLVHALSGGSILTGNVLSSNANILIDAGTNIATGTIGSATDTELDAGGNVSIGTANVGGSLLVDAGGNFTTGAVIANLIDATAGGLATLNGLWQSPDVELFSNDIDIAAGGGIDAGNSGFIRLVSTNGTQALIGDGLSGTGYALSDAEFGRLSSGSLEIDARGDASAAIDMLIGDLAISGPLAGSTIDDPFGSVTFATGDLLTETPGGVIRVTGSITANGFTDTNSLEFFADRFELDAASGLIDITSNGTTLSGELFIDAARVHVASSSILDQLAANPNYSGHEDDLNAPAAVQRPDGVIRAGSIEVFANGPLAVLVQNTGTADNPAGFLTLGDGPLLNGQQGPFGPIELIINGQLVTEGGTLTGSDVLTFLIDANNIGFFTANSTINGCLLTGQCSSPSPIPEGDTPTPGIQDEITLVDDELFPPPDFGNEDVIDDNDEDTDDSETSPIIPPDPLFDTSELGDAAAGGTEGPEVGTSMRSTPGLTSSGDVDDPVSGSGNPGLMENPPPPTNEEKQQ